MPMLRIRWFLAVVLLGVVTFSCSQSCAETTFEHVKIRRPRSPQNRVLVDKVGSLTFDDDHQLISFTGGAGDKLTLKYDAVSKVVFEVTSHTRGGALSQVVSAAGIPGAIAGTAIAGRGVHDYWRPRTRRCSLRYRRAQLTP